VVARRVTVVERLVTEPVRKRVDTEGSLLDEEDAQDTAVDETSLPVTPAETGNNGGEDEAHEEDDLEIVTVLPDNDWVIVEVRDVGTSNSLGVLLHEHPAKVRVEQTLANRVGVLVGVGVSVVCAVVASPPSDGALDGTTTNGSEENLERKRGVVGSVCPQTVVASSDAETGCEVVRNGPNGGCEPERSPEGGNAASHRNADDERDIEPIDVLVPISAVHRGIGDVRFVWVVAL